MKRKWLCFLLVAVMAVSVMGCGAGSHAQSETEAGAVEDNTEADAADEEVDAEAEEDPDEMTEKEQLVYDLLVGTYEYYDEEYDSGELLEFDNGIIHYTSYSKADRSKDSKSDGVYIVKDDTVEVTINDNVTVFSYEIQEGEVVLQFTPDEGVDKGKVREFKKMQGGDSDSQEAPVEQLEVGQTASTDYIEFTLNDAAFTEYVGLDQSDWLKPSTSGWVVSDNELFLWVSTTVKNLETGQIGGQDAFDIEVIYQDKYHYDRQTLTDAYGWSTTQGVANNTGMGVLDPLTSLDIWGVVSCVKEMRDNKDDVKIMVTLPSSTGDKTFVYSMPISDNAVTGEYIPSLVEALNVAEEQLDFAGKYAGNAVGKGFAASFIEELRTAFDNVDIGQIESEAPELAEKVKDVHAACDEVCSLLEGMHDNNSGQNVPTIESLCSETLNKIHDLENNELSANS